MNDNYRHIKLIKINNNIKLVYRYNKKIFKMPDFIEVQKKSYKRFINFGIKKIINDLPPIIDYNKEFRLDFIDIVLCAEKIKYSANDCKNIDMTFSIPVKIKVKMHKKIHGKRDIKEYEIFVGDLPLMTKYGSFIINGAERVIVGQLIKSPGIYCTIKHSKTGKTSYSSYIMPNRGVWIKYAIRSNGTFTINIDKAKKIPITIFIRALGCGKTKQIIDLFGNEPEILSSLKLDKTTCYYGGIIVLYSKLRSNETFNIDNAERLIYSMFYDNKYYDLSIVGRYKINQKLSYENRILNYILAKDVINPINKKIIATKGTIITRKIANKIQNEGIRCIIINNNGYNVNIVSNMMVDINYYVSNIDSHKFGLDGRVYYPILRRMLRYYGKDGIKKAIENDINKLICLYITRDDFFSSINYMINLKYDMNNNNDIDHLGSRRVKLVGELLQNQYKIGFIRLSRAIKEKVLTQDANHMSIHALMNIKPLLSTIKDFFNSSQLSQFMDQNNPLSELTHKRRLSALGPGGLSRERAGFEVRDIHYTHYGRMCPIETPEGPNIGLINSLACYAKIDKYGFIKAPYRKINKNIHNIEKTGPIVTNKIVYMSANEEDLYHIAQANEPLDKNGYFVNKNVAGRYKNEIQEFDRNLYDYMDVSPQMIFSPATSLIPFLQNDDANRALMGANMQRQAVPLLTTELPIIETGIEHKIAVDSGSCVIAEKDGVVIYVSSILIIVQHKDGTKKKYKIRKFNRSNQSNCYNQQPIVNKNDYIKSGQVLADGPAISNGELALGKNPLIGFMPWEGYNYEDAILISERLVQDDVYTSVHIERYEIMSRDTKLGVEEITRDIPGINDDALRNLDINGIIRIGAEVHANDILVGKITPKGVTELTPEERLLRAIFAEKSRDVKDTSLRLPHGEQGIVINVEIFTKDNNKELLPGVNKFVRVYVAQLKKISEGDKMSGRHGNKGVVAKILPKEDMPFLENGEPLDILLNPLGVPSRMNVGQVLEIHLSLAAKMLGCNIINPVFEGANENDIRFTLKLANDYVNMKWDKFSNKYINILDKKLFIFLHNNKNHRKLWKGVNISKNGKVKLRDGRTGEYFDKSVTVGYMYYLKLHHLVDNKIHARSIGPYSLVTQQPLGGKAQFGGQRFGEMEVWALYSYGASYTLRELLTLKSDDIIGRIKTYEAIIKGKKFPKPKSSEAFRVFLKEAQALCLTMQIFKKNKKELNIIDNNDKNK